MYFLNQMLRVSLFKIQNDKCLLMKYIDECE